MSPEPHVVEASRFVPRHPSRETGMALLSLARTMNRLSVRAGRESEAAEAAGNHVRYAYFRAEQHRCRQSAKFHLAWARRELA
ncbi:MAG: hypothetical protein AB7I42_25120 [Bradyrhizobium sp.]|uniref:hypothetical protein n=1 Tax=Bradyrhizobium sp. TaxID=376 RepID=UPI003D0DCC9C